VIYKQLYWPDTNVLLTRFLSPDGVGEIEDFMPVGRAARVAGCEEQMSPGQGGAGQRDLRGELRARLPTTPGRAARVDREERRGLEGAGLKLALSSHVSLHATERGASARFVLKPRGSRRPSCCTPWPRVRGAAQRGTGNELFEEAVRFWRQWLSKCTYRGRWREIVYRSALVLKVLTYDPTGAIVRRAHLQLPEEVAEVRKLGLPVHLAADAGALAAPSPLEPMPQSRRS